MKLIYPMVLGFNARSLSTKNIRGWSRYTLELLESMPLSVEKIYLFSDRQLNTDLFSEELKKRVVLVVVSKKPYIFWEQVTLMRLCYKYNVDVLHCPIHYGLPFFGNFKKVLTLHDCIEKAFMERQKKTNLVSFLVGLKTSLLYYLSRKSADHIITVSEHSKSDLCRYYGIREQKISVIYEASSLRIGGNEEFFSPAPYLFYVGGFEERKNIDSLLTAMSLVEEKGFHLILAGKVDSNKYSDRLKQLGIDDRVHFIGWISDDALARYYKNALGFIYPSLYEGFGLQAVESMSFGTPVLAAERASLPEIVATAGQFFNPEDPSEISQCIEGFIKNPKLQGELRVKALKRSKDFDWGKAARATVTLYRRLMSSS